MSSLSKKKTSKAADEKNIVVSFASDSEDSDSTTSSRELSSEDEKTISTPASAAASDDKAKPPATNHRDSDATQTVTSPSPPSVVTSQQAGEENETSSSSQEKTTSKAKKTKSKDTIGKAATEAVSENGSSSTPEKTTKSGDVEPTSDEVKTVKKKKTPKTEQSATNGTSEPINDVSSNQSESTEEGKKKTSKTSKKSSKTNGDNENGSADIEPLKTKGKTIEDIAESNNAKNNENLQASTAVDEAAVPKPSKKTTKKSSKTATTAADNEAELTTTNAGAEKIPDKKLTKKAREITEEAKTPAVGSTVKSNDDDQTAASQATNGQQKDTATAEQTGEKVKTKKKKEKTADVKVENENEIKPESIGDATEGGSKIIKKKKPKKVVSDEISTTVNATSPFVPTPEITVQNADAIAEDDMDADREVQSICDSQVTDNSFKVDSPKGPMVEESSDPTNFRETELPPTAADGVNGETKGNFDTLQSTEITSSSSPTSLKSAVKPSEDEQAPAAVLSDDVVPAPVATDSDTLADKQEDKSHLSVGEKSDAGSSRENEESDYTYRRKSMDDFIKRILAEAREEQQKKMNPSSQSSTDQNSATSAPVPTIEIKTEPVQDVETSAQSDNTLDRKLAPADRSPANSRTLEDVDASKKKDFSGDLDLDDDLAQIKGFLNRRKLDKAEDDTSGTDTGFRNRASRYGVGSIDDDVGLSQKLLSNDGTSSFLSRSRQQDSSSLANDEFAPRRSDETSEAVRSSVRPVRSVIDQQTDVIQQLKTTSHSIDDLENEIRSLRETFLDRQARIESLRTAIDAECRIYDTEQTAANERIQQQQLPGGRFVRDDFMASFNSGGRQRTGSVSSSSGLGLGTTSIGGLSDFAVPPPQRASSVKPSSIIGDASLRPFGDTEDDSLTTSDSYLPARYRRGGSVARERTYTTDEMLSVGNGIPSWSSRLSSLQPVDMSSSSASSWSAYSPTTVPDIGRYQPTSYSSSSYTRSQYDPNSYKYPSSYGSTTTAPYSSTSSRLGLGTERSSYLRDSTSPGPSVSSSYVSSMSTDPPQRFRRAQSVFDVGSEPSYSTYNSNRSYGTTPSGSGEFQSRFLDKVRGKAGLGDDGRSDSSQFKSRFLRSTYDSSSKKY